MATGPRDHHDQPPFDSGQGGSPDEPAPGEEFLDAAARELDLDAADLGEVLSGGDFEELAAEPPGAAAPSPPAIDMAHAEAELADLDDLLARQAEDTIKASQPEGEFDLEGEFLSQEEVSRILAEESGKALDESLEELAESADAEPAGGLVAEPAAEPIREEDLGPALEVEAEPAREPDTQPKAESETESEPESVAEAEPQSASPESSQEIPRPRADRDSPRSTTDEHDSSQQPASASAQRPSPASDSAALPAAASAELKQAPAVSADDEGVAAVLESDGLAPTADESVGQGEAPAEPVWLRLLVRAATWIDWPFRGVPSLAKNIIGIIAGATALAGAVVWVLAMLL